MLSHRRMKLLAIGVLALIIIVFYYSGESRMVQNQEFYRSTVAAMDAYKEAKDSGKGAVPKHTEQETKKIVDDRMEPAIPKNNDNDMEEISIAGRTKMTVPKNRNDQDNQKQQEVVADDHQEAKAELNSILKRSPIIIFSKSYCPHSARAKTILLNKYSIVPAPYVVELDQHPLGRQLQSLLADKTGRGTVPNVLVSGRSIGGGDDVTALDEKGELASTLKTLAGKWVQEALSDAQPAIFAPPKKASGLPRRISILSNDRPHDDIDNPPLGHSTTHAVKMRYIQSEERLPIPENVKIHIRSRVVTVEGPRGKLVKDLSHIAVTFGRPEKDVISIEMHHGVRKGIATLRTVRTLINNLIIGVTIGFKYKMRYVYAHFPINVNIEKNSETGLVEIEIRNFLGEKYVRRVTAQPGVEIITSPNVKDELQLSGNSLEGVSQSAADIQQICRVRNKDIRKFLDGLYVSERGNIVEE
ncbi:hypothetical protein FE257_010173 [Aspergillus nanangensis]|uniref:Uncharacterized protein n=1 Tax=Aspergillus nanangensis TaxID=2582783 RepID=A0AAD4GSD1_ASPNN|nr:hypothetical protein FE257_010173 [Aspergillus nanangensis]